MIYVFALLGVASSLTFAGTNLFFVGADL